MIKAHRRARQPRGLGLHRRGRRLVARGRAGQSAGLRERYRVMMEPVSAMNRGPVPTYIVHCFPRWQRLPLDHPTRPACGTRWRRCSNAAATALGILWTPFQLDRTLGSNGNGVRFVDVAHGAVVIEYEARGSFGGREGAKLRHAGDGTANTPGSCNGRKAVPCPSTCWPPGIGSHISFGRFDQNEPRWEPLSAFDEASALRLLLALRDNGAPLVHPLLLAQMAGPKLVDRR